jgi:hypothetical protein
MPMFLLYENEHNRKAPNIRIQFVGSATYARQWSQFIGGEAIVHIAPVSMIKRSSSLLSGASLNIALKLH